MYTADWCTQRTEVYTADCPLLQRPTGLSSIHIQYIWGIRRQPILYPPFIPWRFYLPPPPPPQQVGGVLGSISIFRPSTFLFLEYLTGYTWRGLFCLSRKCSEYAVKYDRIRPLKGPQHEIFRRNLFNADSLGGVLSVKNFLHAIRSESPQNIFLFVNFDILIKLVLVVICPLMLNLSKALSYFIRHRDRFDDALRTHRSRN